MDKDKIYSFTFEGLMQAGVMLDKLECPEDDRIVKDIVNDIYKDCELDES